VTDRSPDRPALSLDRPAPHVALLTLDKPDRLNALDWATIVELDRVLRELDADDDLRALVVTGAGRGFCAGLDLHESGAFAATMREVYANQERVAGVAVTLRRMTLPVIAAVNGPAAGAGLAIALASDVRLAAPTATFSAAFVRLGLSGCDVGVSYLLPRIVGLGMASEMMLTGRSIEADTALRTGLVNRVVPADDLLGAALELAGEIAANAPFGVRMTKQVVQQNVDAPSLEAAVELENRTQVLAVSTEDNTEAVAAFRERRVPTFTGR